MIKLGKPRCKCHKNSASFRNNKMVFLYVFSACNNHSIPSCKKTRKKKQGNMVLYFYFAFNRQAVHIKLKIKKNQEKKNLHTRLNLFVGFVECNKFFTH